MSQICSNNDAAGRRKPREWLACGMMTRSNVFLTLSSPWLVMFWSRPPYTVLPRMVRTRGALVSWLKVHLRARECGGAGVGVRGGGGRPGPSGDPIQAARKTHCVLHRNLRM